MEISALAQICIDLMCAVNLMIICWLFNDYCYSCDIKLTSGMLSQLQEREKCLIQEKREREKIIMKNSRFQRAQWC